jgi:hypothetical protein
MRRRVLATLGGVAIVASILALVPNEAEARFGGGGGASGAVVDLGAVEVSGAADLVEEASGAECRAEVLEEGLLVAASEAGYQLPVLRVPASVVAALSL